MGAGEGEGTLKGEGGGEEGGGGGEDLGQGRGVCGQQSGDAGISSSEGLFITTAETGGMYLLSLWKQCTLLNRSMLYENLQRQLAN